MAKIITHSLITASLLGLVINTHAETDTSTAARFALNDPSEFIANKISTFSINSREFDPFGKPQDPNKKVVNPTIEAQPKATKKQEEKILIRKEIYKLGSKVNILGRYFTIGSTTYRRNDKITVSVKGKEFTLKVNSIHRNRITFFNYSDNSIITLDLNKTGPSLDGGDDKPSLDSNNKKVIEL